MTDAYPTCACGCGTSGDEAHGMCKAAYNRWRRRQIAYNRWRSRVSVDAAREHVQRLLDAGLRVAQVAELAGTSRNTIRNITLPETARISADIERAVLAVDIPRRPGDVVADSALVPIIGARRRIQALIAHGYPQTYLARELGVAANHAIMSALVERRLLVGHTGQRISAARERAVKALFDRLQMIPGPSRRARDYGKKRGWALPFEWDEDAIDNPDGQPFHSQWTSKSARAERRDRVLELTGRGMAALEIASHLGVTERTVLRDRKHIAVTTQQQEA